VIAERRARQRLRWTIVRGVDLCLITVAFTGAYWARANLDYLAGHEAVPSFSILNWTNAGLFTAILMTAWVATLLVIDEQESETSMRALRPLDEALLVARSLTTSFVFVLAASSLYSRHSLSRGALLLFYVLSLLLVGTWRLALKSVLGRMRRMGYNVTRLLVVGACDVGRIVKRELDLHAEYGIRLVGFLDEAPPGPGAGVEGAPCLGAPDRVGDVIEEHGITDVWIARPDIDRPALRMLIRECEDRHVNAALVPALADLSLVDGPVAHVGPLPLLSLTREPMKGAGELVKRAFDLVAAALGLVALAPVFAGILAAIRLDSRGPAIYAQERVGRHGRRFRMYKFRTMVEEADSLRPALEGRNDVAGGVTFKMRDDPRVTRAGWWLRRFSLDELPQFYNVVAGDMSLVGPRPPLVGEVHRYSEWARRRLDTVPGMTGLWQVSGRSDVGFESMVELDLYYIEHWSFWLDLQLLIRTIPVVMGGRGAY
jgi:exopolysaccharide biosynthesis polyprenyl glycosylphosphotransferase